jgi:hypothetical protein
MIALKKINQEINVFLILIREPEILGDIEVPCNGGIFCSSEADHEYR